MNFNSFDVDLFNTICEISGKDGNTLISPLSISLALTMLLLGSEGQTKEQLEEALGFQTDDDDILEMVKALYCKYNKRSVEFKVSHCICPSESFQMSAQYKRRIATAFCCQMQNLDFKKDAEGSRKTINEMISDFTNGKIENLISKLTPETTCMLVSCIYFKGNWDIKFHAQATRSANFYCAEDKQPSTVEMMSLVNDLKFYHSDAKKFKSVKLHYDKKDFSLIIILPDEQYGLNDVIQELDARTIEYLKDYNKFKFRYIDLKLPKFKMESNTKLIDSLRLLGVKDAFDEKAANFSSMSEDALQADSRLYVSELVHKVFVDVNEEGTEAAAATAPEIGPALQDRPEPIPFVVDHPFVFMILFKSQTLFLGKVTSL